MGYCSMMYTVDLAELRRIVAEHDASVLPQIRSADPDEWEARFDDEEPTVGEAVEAIVRGNTLNPAFAHQYGYALKQLCEHVGEFTIDLGGLDYLELGSPLEEVRLPIDIPPPDDFPVVSYLSADEVKSEATRVAALSLSHSDEDVAEEREAYADFVRETAAKGQAIVMFYH